MGCRNLVAPNEQIKTGVVCCVECDPDNQFKRGRLDVGAMRKARSGTALVFAIVFDEPDLHGDSIDPAALTDDNKPRA